MLKLIKSLIKQHNDHLPGQEILLLEGDDVVMYQAWLADCQADWRESQDKAEGEWSQDDQPVTT